MNRRRHSTLPNLILVTGVLALCFGCTRSTPPVAKTSAGTVTIEIISGDTTQSLQVQDVAPGTTVEVVMRSIDEIPVTVNGSGVTAFVDTIGDLSTGTGQGWTYKVDGELANQGIGSTRLTPPTTITWSYGEAGEMLRD